MPAARKGNRSNKKQEKFAVKTGISSLLYVNNL